MWMFLELFLTFLEVRILKATDPLRPNILEGVIFLCYPMDGILSDRKSSSKRNFGKEVHKAHFLKKKSMKALYMGERGLERFLFEITTHESLKVPFLRIGVFLKPLSKRKLLLRKCTTLIFFLPKIGPQFIKKDPLNQRFLVKEKDPLSDLRSTEITSWKEWVVNYPLLDEIPFKIQFWEIGTFILSFLKAILKFTESQKGYFEIPIILRHP